MKKEFFKKMSSAFLAAIFLVFFVFCIISCSNTKKLYLFNWTYYTPDSVIKKFEAKFNCKIIYDSFDTNESMFAKLKAGGSSYDLVVPSADYVSIMIKEGMLAEIDKSKISNFINLDSAVLAKSADFDPNSKYSVPYYMGAAGIAVNKKKVSNFGNSWSIFSRSDLKGKMVMLDDMREVMGDALSYLGKNVNSVNDDDINSAKNLIINKWKPNLLKFDAEAYAKGFATGEYWVAQGYAESIFQEADPSMYNDISFFIPKEGGPLYIDYLVILKSSKNKALAHEFINFFHEPEIYAEFADTFGFPSTANVSARALKKGKEYYSVKDLEKCQLKIDLGESLDKYNKAWLDIKVGK